MSKKWQYYENVDIVEVEKLEKQFNVNKMLAEILVNRGVTTKNAREFLEPNRHDFYDPFLMPDMEKAVDRIIRGIENKEKIIIFGDYDVDGITSITVLKSFLEDRGIKVDSYIPNRLSEGYGLNKEAIMRIAKENYTLMITVDCGITGIEEVELAKSLGIDTIITDHHEPIEILPKAIAVVDCKRKDNKYPFRELAGVGVAFKVTQGLSIKLKLEEKEYLKYLDIVSIGTISDIVPLIDENRVITLLGLKLVKETRNIGLKAILKQSGFKNIDSGAISFGVAPRLNACGRMGEADKGLELLLTKDIKEATILSQEINDYNIKRQQEEKRIYEEALMQIEKGKQDLQNAIVLKGIGWHHGVIGIVASKITENYFKPAILVCYEGEEVGKGSGRSIPGFDLHKALLKIKDTLVAFGGHSMAVGVSVKEQDFERFKKEFLEITKEEKIENIEQILYIDGVLNIDEISKQMVESISKLEPFGEANKMPIFAIKNLKIDSIRSLTEGKHLKLTLKSSNNYYVNAIGFNLGHLADEYRIGDKVNVAGSIEINSFNGKDTIQINLKDMMRSI